MFNFIGGFYHDQIVFSDILIYVYLEEKYSYVMKKSPWGCGDVRKAKLFFFLFWKKYICILEKKGSLP